MLEMYKKFLCGDIVDFSAAERPLAQQMFPLLSAFLEKTRSDDLLLAAFRNHLSMSFSARSAE
jgi:hypothetical protein